MVKFIALRTVHGDYGTKDPGQVFEVEEWQAKKLAPLEARGIIARFRSKPKVDRKMYTAYENKAVQAAAVKTK